MVIAKDLELNPHLLKVPVFPPGKSTVQLQQELGIKEIVKLGSNENPLGPSPRAIEAIKRAAEDVHHYPSVEVYDLRCRLADSLGSGLHTDNIIVGNGSANVILSLAQAFLFGGGEVVISTPTFEMYALATNMYGGRCVFVESQDYHCDLQAMADKITDQTRLVFVANPNNPTGLIVTQQEVDDFMLRVPSSVVVVFDEAYCEYVEVNEYPDTMQYVRQGRNVVITRTFSKIYGLAGMRVGYGVAHGEIIQHLLHTQPPFHSDRLALIAATAALEDRHHRTRAQKVNAEEKEYLYRGFEALGLEYLRSQANFVMLVDLEHDGQEIAQALLRHGIIVCPGISFGISRALRATIGQRNDNERFLKALQQVLHQLDNGGSRVLISRMGSGDRE